MMEKGWRRSAGAKAIATICLLSPMIYAALVGYNIHPLDLSMLQSWRSDLGRNRSSSNSMELAEDLPIFSLRRLVRGKERKELDDNGVSCVSDLDSDMCVTKDAVGFDPNISTLYVAPTKSANAFQHTVRPYALKRDDLAMSAVTPVLLRRDPVPACQVTHTVPAILFSSGGFSTNVFHDFNDILIPLFLTSRQFRSRVQFVIVDFKPGWVRKFRPILTHLSNYDPIDSSNDGRRHCFPAAVVGLKLHGDLFCNSTEAPGGYSIHDFRHFLRIAFSLDQNQKAQEENPALVLITRRNSRLLLNEDEIIRMAEELGFQVRVVSPQRMANLEKFAQVVNSCSVLVGAHGAGLTNSLFLPKGGVLVQVVPLGLDWPSKTYYGDTAMAMGLHYLEYRIKAEESTLLAKYGPDHPAIKDPTSIHMQGYRASRAVYIDGQNMSLDVERFRHTLQEAMRLVGPSRV